MAAVSATAAATGARAWLGTRVPARARRAVTVLLVGGGVAAAALLPG